MLKNEKKTIFFSTYVVNPIPSLSAVMSNLGLKCLDDPLETLETIAAPTMALPEVSLSRNLLI